MMLSAMETEHYHKTYSSQIAKLLETLEKRLLPTFDSVGEEASEIQKEAQSLYQYASASNEWLDPARASEVAFEAGMEHFDMVLDIRQGLLNLFAANLFHLFEQQIREFNSRILGLPDKRHASEVLKAWDTVLGKSIFSTDQQTVMSEVSLLAHTVKHGDGNSSEKLFAIAPNLFREQWEHDFDDDPTVKVHKPAVYAPLFGKGIYVTIDDLRRYTTALINAWAAIFQAFA